MTIDEDGTMARCHPRRRYKSGAMKAPCSLSGRVFFCTHEDLGVDFDTLFFLNNMYEIKAILIKQISIDIVLTSQ